MKTHDLKYDIRSSKIRRRPNRHFIEYIAPNVATAQKWRGENEYTMWFYSPYSKCFGNARRLFRFMRRQYILQHMPIIKNLRQHTK